MLQAPSSGRSGAEPADAIARGIERAFSTGSSPAARRGGRSGLPDRAEWVVLAHRMGREMGEFVVQKLPTFWAVTSGEVIFARCRSAPEAIRMPSRPRRRSRNGDARLRSCSKTRTTEPGSSGTPPATVSAPDDAPTARTRLHHGFGRPSRRARAPPRSRSSCSASPPGRAFRRPPRPRPPRRSTGSARSPSSSPGRGRPPGERRWPAGYMRITNAGTEPDRLVGGTFAASRRFELHEMSVGTDNVMRMRPLENGLEIKPGATVELKPGSFHAMFLDLHRALKEGESLDRHVAFREGRDPRGHLRGWGPRRARSFGRPSRPPLRDGSPAGSAPGPDPDRHETEGLRIESCGLCAVAGRSCATLRHDSFILPVANPDGTRHEECRPGRIALRLRGAERTRPAGEGRRRAHALRLRGRGPVRSLVGRRGLRRNRRPDAAVLDFSVREAECLKLARRFDLRRASRGLLRGCPRS